MKERGNGEVLFNGYRVSAWDVKKVHKMESVDCTTL